MITHREPADQIIVATAGMHDCGLPTLDYRIRAYAHVKIEVSCLG
jgi:PIN domain nuclease of toxin-antitoxin system